MSSTRILVTGCLGRMGIAVADCADRDDGATVAHKIDLEDSLMEVLPDCDSVIDFSFHTFTTELVEGCLKLKKQLVMGTTGHTEEELKVIREASKEIPIVFSPNFSVGVNTLFWLTRKAAEILGPEFDLEVVEMHHRMKQDAPSGTAKHLAEILADVRKLSYGTDTRHGRQGDVGARTDDEIGVHSMRGGDVVGDHTVVYAALGERVELTHKASSRDTFAMGSVRAAKWLNDKPAGLYDMLDVLGLR
ncbi:MAG: 4-hydroxy-tetrahydrodipicolinate reductase [Verrucomicrobiota bacterium]